MDTDRPPFRASAVALVAPVALVVVVAGCLGAPAPRTSEDPTTAGTGQATGTGTGTTVRVAKVIDADTIAVEYPNGTRERVRLLGVDAPETRAPNDPAQFEGVPDSEGGAACLRDWGNRAGAFARDRLAGERVRIATDQASPRRGLYGRLLAYVYVEGESFNYELVVRGYARVYESDFAELDRYLAAEFDARREQVGLWDCATDRPATATGTATETVTDGGAPIAIAEVHYDAAGNDNRNLDDEYVVLVNVGEDPVEMGGWTVRDEAGHVYRFPEGFALGPGERATVHTGRGTDTATDLYWGRDGAVWNNDGDTVIVEDETGRTVVRDSY